MHGTCFKVTSGGIVPKQVQSVSSLLLISVRQLPRHNNSHSNSNNMQVQKHKQEAQTSPSKTADSPKRTRSVYIPKRKSNNELNSLSEYNIELSPVSDKKITIELIVQYIEGLIQNLYGSDPLKFKELIADFLANDLQKIRPKLQERLSLLKYLCESLRYKQFGQIDLEMQKEWRKNILMVSINIIWTTRMDNYKFVSAQEFLDEYRKYAEMVANLTHFYFQHAFVLLQHKQVPVFAYIKEETCHTIINSLSDWEDLYHIKLIPLLKKKNLRHQNEMNMDFDLNTLQINPKYINIHSQQIQLPQTILAIKLFSEQHTIICKIQRLKQIRATFLKEIQLSRQALELKYNYHAYSPLQKDDIIGCMIYCIVKGQLHNIQVCLQAMSEMLGYHCELLSRKGVDSYRADLESAVQYLVQQNQPEIITGVDYGKENDV